MVKKVELIIFDLDGTLVDAYPAIVKSFNYTMQKIGLEKEDQLTIRKSVGWGDRMLLLPFVGERNIEKALRIYRKRHRVDLTRGSRLLSGAENILNYLSKKKI